MKKTLCLLALCMSFSVIAQTSNITILQKSLKPWQPISINEKDGVINMALNENQVTSQIYLAVVSLGVCMPAWDKTNNAYLKNTKEVRILNKHNYMGYVLENPRSTCDDLGAAVGDNATNSIILSHTHMNMNH